MAKHADLITHEEIEDVEFEASHHSRQKTKQEQTLEDILSTLNDRSDDAYIAVYKQKGTGKESMSLVGKWPGDEFPSSEDLLLFLRDNYGGGSYRVHVRINGRLAANNLVSVEEPLKRVNTSNNNEPIIQLLEKQQLMINELYNKMATQNAPQPAPSRREMLEEMSLIASMFNGGGGSQGRGFSDIARDIQAIKEISPMLGLGGPVEEKDPFNDLIEKAAPLFQHAMTQPQPQPKKENPAMMRQALINAQIKTGITTLVNAAAKGRDPGEYADLVLDNLGDDMARQYAIGPEAFKKVVGFVPQAKQYENWFADLSEHIKAQLGEPSKFSGLYDDDGDDINSDNLSPAPGQSNEQNDTIDD